MSLRKVDVFVSLQLFTKQWPNFWFTLTIFFCWSIKPGLIHWVGNLINLPSNWIELIWSTNMALLSQANWVDWGNYVWSFGLIKFTSSESDLSSIWKCNAMRQCSFHCSKNRIGDIFQSIIYKAFKLLEIASIWLGMVITKHKNEESQFKQITQPPFGCWSFGQRYQGNLASFFVPCSPSTRRGSDMHRLLYP